MTQKRNWQTKFLIPGLIVIAAFIWACNGAAQPAATPVVEAPAATATTAMPTVQVTVPPTLTAVTILTSTGVVTGTATVTPSTTATSTTATTTTTSSDTRVFTVDQSQSKANFILDEVLMGTPKTVVGTTSLVSAAITIDLADPTKTTISPIQIDARDFTTDSSMRNNAIRRFVLQSNSDENRYIVFTPTAIEGLPTAAKVGDTLELKIVGDLTISGVTKPATFVTSVKVESDAQISGTAKAHVLRSDYNLNIPNVPSVADVTDEVQLEFAFVAKA
ncbi:MAG: YceI family protein [Chloroflexi bacterium]|nr:YceI family protein [Chloroflexota bacterium]